MEEGNDNSPSSETSPAEDSPPVPSSSASSVIDESIRSETPSPPYQTAPGSPSATQTDIASSSGDVKPSVTPIKNVQQLADTDDSSKAQSTKQERHSLETAATQELVIETSTDEEPVSPPQQERHSLETSPTQKEFVIEESSTDEEPVSPPQLERHSLETSPTQKELVIEESSTEDTSTYATSPTQEVIEESSTDEGLASSSSPEQEMYVLKTTSLADRDSKFLLMEEGKVLTTASPVHKEQALKILPVPEGSVWRTPGSVQDGRSPRIPSPIQESPTQETSMKRIHSSSLSPTQGEHVINIISPNLKEQFLQSPGQEKRKMISALRAYSPPPMQSVCIGCGNICAKRILKCAHSECQYCLEARIATLDGFPLRCKVCFTRAPLSIEDVRLMDLDFMELCKLDVWREPPPPCNGCGKKSFNGIVKCFHCDRVLCVKCNISHQTHHPLHRRNIMPWLEVCDGQVLVPCMAHSPNTFTHICLDCTVLMCVACVDAEDLHRGHHYESIATYCNNYKAIWGRSYKQMLVKCENIKNQAFTASLWMKNLEAQRLKAEQDISDRAEELIRQIHTKKEELLESLRMERYEDITRLWEQVDNLAEYVGKMSKYFETPPGPTFGVLDKVVLAHMLEDFLKRHDTTVYVDFTMPPVLEFESGVVDPDFLKFSFGHIREYVENPWNVAASKWYAHHMFEGYKNTFLGQEYEPFTSSFNLGAPGIGNIAPTVPPRRKKGLVICSDPSDSSKDGNGNDVVPKQVMQSGASACTKQDSSRPSLPPRPTDRLKRDRQPKKLDTQPKELDTQPKKLDTQTKELDTGSLKHGAELLQHDASKPCHLIHSDDSEVLREDDMQHVSSGSRQLEFGKVSVLRRVSVIEELSNTTEMVEASRACPNTQSETSTDTAATRSVATKSINSPVLCPSLISRKKLFAVGTFGKFGKNVGEFKEPSGIAWNKNGNIIVADSLKHKIQIFDNAGKYVSSNFESEQHNVDKIVFPIAVAIIESKQEIAVLLREPKSRVHVYSLEGTFKRKIGVLTLTHPCGLCTDKYSSVIVLENKPVLRNVESKATNSVTNRHLVTSFSSGGVKRMSFSCDDMKFPVAIASNGKELFVADRLDSCVKVFGYNGHFLRKLGGEGITDQPITVFIQPDGCVGVAGNHPAFSVTILKPDGEVVEGYETMVHHPLLAISAAPVGFNSEQIAFTSRTGKVFIYSYYNNTSTAEGRHLRAHSK